MIRKGLFLVCALLIPALLLAAKPLEKQGQEQEKAKTEQTDTASVKKPPTTTSSSRARNVRTVKGLVTIHKVDGEKLYSRAAGCRSSVARCRSDRPFRDQQQRPRRSGLQGQDPLHVTFAKEGHKKRAALPGQRHLQRRRQGQGHRRSGAPPSIPGIYRAFKIEAYNADSTAVVIDVTNLFMEDNDDLTPFDPYSTFGYKPFSRTTSFQKSNSHLGDIKARGQRDRQELPELHHHRNLLERPDDRQDRGQSAPSRPLSPARCCCSPEKEMRPRIADPRMNIFVTGKARFSSNMNRGTLPVYARHWRVEPKDVEAYKRGELVREPVKPIVFYLDRNLPEAWKTLRPRGVSNNGTTPSRRSASRTSFRSRLPPPGGGPRVRSPTT